MCAVCVSLSLLLLYPSASEPDYKRVVLHRSDFSEETLQRFPRAFLIRFLDLSSRFLPFSFFHLPFLYFVSSFPVSLCRFFFSSSIPLPPF
uniref:Putative secreted protein n=1 Tax=Ixodes ricinus TaxID=34613 RepID=A0A147BAR9_IXORI